MPPGKGRQPLRAHCRTLCRPGRSLPGQNKEPSVNTLVVCSGGLDSVTLAHKVAVERRLIRLVSFDYGQRHRKELEFARACATRLGVAHDVVDISDIGRRLSGSALTDGAAVPPGDDARDTKAPTPLPQPPPPQ